MLGRVKYAVVEVVCESSEAGRAETVCVSEELQVLQGQVKIRSTSHESAEEGLNDDHVRKRCLRTVCHGTLSSPIVVDQLRSDGEMWFV